MEQILRRADDCLYYSKRHGRDRVTIDGEASVLNRQLKTLLYVDDDPDIREIVQMSLSLDGQLNVITSDGGERAVLKMAVEQPDLVVLDVMMPGLDGLAAARRVRASGRTVPIMMVTGRDSVRGLEVVRYTPRIEIVPVNFASY